MTTLHGLPAPLVDYLSAAHGEPLERERLGGKSGAVVERVRFAATTLIVKGTPNPAEPSFYAQTAPALVAAGIPLPHVEFQYTHASTFWLVLEAIPHPLPRDDWHGSSHVLDVLARLHALDPHIIPMPQNAFVPAWTDSHTDAALACFPRDAAQTLAPRLHDIQAASAPLFEPHCCISGDPNPANWGVRDDGTLVLFDWERFTLAHPTVDLAICVGGLGSREQFAHVARVYLVQRDRMDAPLPITPHDLAGKIARAKVWTVVEYMALYTTGHLVPDPTLDYLIAYVPAWLESLSRLSN